VLDHYKLQAEGDQAYHVATVQAVQDRDSSFNSHNVSLGAALARNDVNSLLDAEGAECCLNGLFAAGGRQHVDNHTLLDHAKPHGTSRELYKGILGGHAAGVFNGKIIVRKDAQKTNAIQSNRNLLVSGDAVINTKPQLEIYADDVRCTHGATVGQLDREALFYMQSRGIPALEAGNLLTQAFAGEVLDRFSWQPMRVRVQGELHRILTAFREEEAK
jgi:Fe-S cluster assembly protein SufD